MPLEDGLVKVVIGLPLIQPASVKTAPLFYFFFIFNSFASHVSRMWRASKCVASCHFRSESGTLNPGKDWDGLVFAPRRF